MGQNHKQNISAQSEAAKSRAEQGVVTATATATAPLLLDEYIRRVVGSSYSYSSIFPTQHRSSSSSSSSPAILERGRTNHVLLYNGCFNPPHRGHLAQLVHALRHAGPGMHVVGAVVLVADDAYLKWKLAAGQRGALLLGLEQRIRLWDEELALVEEGARCWVLPEVMWPQYADGLEGRFERDGVDVEFVRLAGGDKVSVAAVEHGVWGCRDIITSDVSRPVDFYSGGVGDVALPMPLRRHGEWKKVVGEMQGEKDGRDEEVVSSETLTTESTIISSSSTSTSAPQTSTTTAITPQTSRSVWTCGHGPSGSYHNVRFIASSHDERVDPDLSSTKIRGIIAAGKKLDVGQLEQRLRGIALSPWLLARYIKEGS
ncbi:hypothetical protein F5Y00DRAFT_270546 [Daldinia vernicosa]|uniref:uncharacterized protein n=1 Tax=Daldinia vernicosa TaxID=114800 RepID=UPI0020072AA8|nr:uncharacterized protein F5Y00DRAFT_270546 [Daldinia vernicosa]KAI0853344.1 hypothetical protein F5Y00DRAFT_270546 [Daldinia vernicosa]